MKREGGEAVGVEVEEMSEAADGNFRFGILREGESLVVCREL